METPPALRTGLTVIAAVATYAAIFYFKAAPKLRVVPEPAPAAGETRVAPPGQHFSLVLPLGWMNVDASDPSFQQARKDRLDRFNATHHTHIRYSPSGHVLFAYDPQTIHDPIERTVAVLIKSSHQTRSDPSARAKQIGDRMAADVPGIRILDAGAAELPIGSIPRVVSSFPTAKDGENTTTVSYSMSDADRLITLTITGMEKDRGQVTALAGRIAGSFRTLP